MSQTAASTLDTTVSEVDKRLPFSQLLLFGLQHVLVMAAVPITSVFLVARAMDLSASLTVNLISATFLLCGLGSLLQSFGPAKLGAKLPFVMVPGGAPIAIFILIARETDLQTAAGAVIMSSLLYFIVLPIYARCLRFFPKIVVGTLLLLVSVNLIRIYGGIIAGRPGTENFGDPTNIGLALATVAFTVFFAKIFKGMLGQLAVLLGLLAGTILAALLGLMSFAEVGNGPVVSFPTFFPFGTPKFDLIAAVPLLVFSVISMVEATGQTVAVIEAVDSKADPRTTVPRTIRGDAVMSFFGGLMGTSMIITSGENIGIVRATNVRSRYVTAMAGVILVLIALVAPLGRLANAIPAAVVGGTAVVVFAIIGTIGINMLRDADLHERSNMFILAGALTMGLMPILVPGLYSQFPAVVGQIMGNGLAAGSITAVLLNLFFHHRKLFDQPAASSAAR